MLQRSLINLSIELYKLLNSSSSICIFATGAASSGISSLLSASGASSTISECRIPYSRLSFIETLKEENISLSSTVSNESFSFASANASNLLAQAALSRCRRLASQEISLGNPISMKTLSKKRYIGIGVAAAVATTLPSSSSSSSSSSVSTSGASALPVISSPSRRGSDRIFITSLIDDGACGIETQRFEYSLHFLKKRDRIDEEAICGAVLVRAVVKAATHGTEFHLLTSIEKIIKDEIERTNTTSTSLSSFSSIETEVEIHESVYSSSTELKNTLLLKNLLSQHSKQQQQEEEEEAEKSHIEDVVRHVLFVPNNTTELSSYTSTTSSSIAFANFPICINSQDSNKRQIRPLILPGSFHPLHSGHETLAKAAVIAANTLWPLNMNMNMNINKDMVDESLKSWIPFFELSVINVDKPPLELEVLQSRLEQFSKRGLNVIATRAPRFIDKVDTFLESTSTSYKVSSSTSTSKDQDSYKVSSSSTSTSTSKDQDLDKTNDTPTLVFVVGFDTAARLVDPKYYTGGSESAVLAALLPWLEKGVRFLVAGRIASASTYTMTTFETTYTEFLTFEKHLKPRLPKVLQPLFVGLDGFREDISSSELRAAK
jgi:hypothetical protein